MVEAKRDWSDDVLTRQQILGETQHVEAKTQAHRQNMLQTAAAFLCCAASIHNTLSSSAWTSWLNQVQVFTLTSTCRHCQIFNAMSAPNWAQCDGNLHTASGLHLQALNRYLIVSRMLLEALRMLISSLRSCRTRAFVLDSGPSRSEFFFSQAFLLFFYVYVPALHSWWTVDVPLSELLSSQQRHYVISSACSVLHCHLESQSNYYIAIFSVSTHTLKMSPHAFTSVC